MSKNRKMTAALASIICILPLLGGCSDTKGPVQSKDFPVGEVKSIEVDYDGESVTVKESDSDKIVIVEYMDKSKKAYLAEIQLSGGVLTVTEGARPIGNGVHSYVELFLPKAYQSSLTLHITNGRITSESALTLDSFRADATNGTIALSNLSADRIDLTSTNADTCLDHIMGEVTFESKGGDLTVTDASGSGNFQATGDGNMDIAFAELTGNLTVSARNGKIELTLPAGLSFAFLAATKNGSIQTPFSELLTFTGETAVGEIGNQTDIEISLETKNGDIGVRMR